MLDLISTFRMATVHRWVLYKSCLSCQASQCMGSSPKRNSLRRARVSVRRRVVMKRGSLALEPQLPG